MSTTVEVKFKEKKFFTNRLRSEDQTSGIEPQYDVFALSRAEQEELILNWIVEKFDKEGIWEPRHYRLGRQRKPSQRKQTWRYPKQQRSIEQ